MTTAHEYARTHAARFVEELKEWVKIPSISADPAFKGDVLRAAEWLAEDMRGIGLENVQVIATKGHPAVYADWLHAGPDKPTILVYGHYDVQPAVIEDGWDQGPFEPVEKNGRLYGRGASDDKGQVMLQLKAAEAMLATQSCPVNLKYIIEGEEEYGSPNLPAFVRDYADLLKADICLISDTSIHSAEQPSITYGLRGLTGLEVIITGPRIDLHSGNGGVVHNPAQALAEIIAKLHDDDGRITVPGFYDDVLSLSDEERAELSKTNLTPQEWDEQIGAPQEWGEPGYSLVERMGARPTLEINGIAGGYAGEGFKTVIGAKAIAKISCRLVPNQHPEKIYELVTNYIRSITPPTVNVDFKRHGMGEPALTDIQHPALRAAIRAYSHSWEKAPLLTRSGGSIPVVADFQKVLNVPVVLLGFTLPDCAAHGPNENFSLEMYRKGIDTVIHYMHEVLKAD